MRLEGSAFLLLSYHSLSSTYLSPIHTKTVPYTSLLLLYYQTCPQFAISTSKTLSGTSSPPLTALTPTTLSPMLITPSLVNLAGHHPSTAGQVHQTTMKGARRHLTTRVHHHLPTSKKILLPHHRQVPTSTPLALASPLAAAAAVLTTEDIMDTTVDHTAMNATAAGADVAVEAGAVAEDAAVANAASIPGPLEAIST